MKEKTYKREVAVTMLLFLAGMGIAAVVWPAEAMPVLETFVYPVFGFAGLAFGMDAYAKQVVK